MASPFPGDSGSGSSQPVANPSSPAEARLFGTFRVVGADGAVLTPTGRKARALLACLLLADGDAVTRDRLTTLLWSKRGEDQARASLRQTLYEMRAPGVAGLSFLMLDRVQARIVTADVVTDLDRVRSFPVDGSGSALATLIGDEPADLLSDLDGIDPAFDEWLVVERARRHDERRRIVLDVCARVLDAGDVDGARRLAACLLAAEPADEAAARLAMQASHQRGDRDGVRLAFARVEEALRSGLGVAVSEDTAELHRRLMASPIAPRATQPTAPAGAANDDADAAVTADPAWVEPVTAPSAASAEHLPDFAARPSRRPSRGVVAGALVVLATTLATWLWLAPPVGAEPRKLLVDGLQVAPGDARAAALGAGLSTELARMVLGHATMLTVADASGAGSHGSSNADFIVTGAAHSDAGMVFANVKLLRERDKTILWSSAFSRPITELDALREQMASRVADVSLCALGNDNPKAAAFDDETLRLLFGACEQKHGDWNESARLLQQVVQREPDFAHGWAMFAAATAVSALMVESDRSALAAKADDYARRALALNAHEGDTYFARALALPGLARWPERMAIVEAGHAADPTNGQIDSQLADELANVGRWREATVYAQRAVDVDPFGMAKAAQRARLLGLGGDVPAANVALRAAERRFGGQRMLVATDFRIQAVVGDAARAQAILALGDFGFSLPPDRATTLKAFLRARAEPSAPNDEAAYRAFTNDLHARPKMTLRDVELLVQLRRTDEAFMLADRLASSADSDDTSALFVAAMQPLRADPRFMTLAARLGLIPIWTRTDRWPDFCEESPPYDCRVEAKRALSPAVRPLVAVR